MYINPTLFGAKITGTARDVTYKTGIFSLSGSITDDDGSLLVSQKRTSWWGLKFDMVAPEGNYKFYQKYFDYFLEHENGQKFRTHSSVDFYNEKMERVTHLRHSNKFGKYWELDIFTEEHKSALVLASITICKLNPSV